MTHDSTPLSVEAPPPRKNRLKSESETFQVESVKKRSESEKKKSETEKNGFESVKIRSESEIKKYNSIEKKVLQDWIIHWSEK